MLSLSKHEAAVRLCGMAHAALSPHAITLRPYGSGILFTRAASALNTASQNAFRAGDRTGESLVTAGRLLIHSLLHAATGNRIVMKYDPRTFAKPNSRISRIKP